MKGLPEKFRHAPDELYAKLRGPAKNLTVLATAFSDKSTGGTGRNEPMLMAIDYGKGRVFHSTMGHGPAQCLSVAFIVTLQRGRGMGRHRQGDAEGPRRLPRSRQAGGAGLGEMASDAAMSERKDPRAERAEGGKERRHFAPGLHETAYILSRITWQGPASA